MVAAGPAPDKLTVKAHQQWEVQIVNKIRLHVRPPRLEVPMLLRLFERSCGVPLLVRDLPRTETSAAPSSRELHQPGCVSERMASTSMRATVHTSCTSRMSSAMLVTLACARALAFVRKLGVSAQSTD